MFRLFFAISIFCFAAVSYALNVPHQFPSGTQTVTIPTVSGVRSDLLQNIAPIIKKSIVGGYYPGAVVLASHRGHIIYRGVFGNRRIVPDIAPMRFNTIFDVASLTKVVATTPAIMQLVEQGKIDLDTPVTKYWPAFAANGKETVTVRELLTHMSGLSSDLSNSISNKPDAYRQAAQLKLTHPPGTAFLYSDANFIVLAYLVEIISGEPFDQYVQAHIFKPLAMSDTLFLPPASLRDRIAPSEVIDHKLRWGAVQDPTAHMMGGVSGNAGLFSGAADLGIYAQCLLNQGRITSTKQQGKKSSNYLLGPLTVLKMTTPQTLPGIFDTRGLGWDIDSVYSNRGVLFSEHSYGHTGWTGTSIWIDPATQTWIIVLTSRTHPAIVSNNQVVQDRRAIANIIAASITDITTTNLINTESGELNRAYVNSVLSHNAVQVAINTKNRM